MATPRTFTLRLLLLLLFLVLSSSAFGLFGFRQSNHVDNFRQRGVQFRPHEGCCRVSCLNLEFQEFSEDDVQVVVYTS